MLLKFFLLIPPHKQFVLTDDMNLSSFCTQCFLINFGCVSRGRVCACLRIEIAAAWKCVDFLQFFFSLPTPRKKSRHSLLGLFISFFSLHVSLVLRLVLKLPLCVFKFPDHRRNKWDGVWELPVRQRGVATVSYTHPTLGEFSCELCFFHS